MPRLVVTPSCHTQQSECPAEKELDLPLELVDNIILNQVNGTDQKVIDDAVARAKTGGDKAVTSTSNTQG